METELSRCKEQSGVYGGLPGEQMLVWTVVRDLGRWGGWQWREVGGFKRYLGGIYGRAHPDPL